MVDVVEVVEVVEVVAVVEVAGVVEVAPRVAKKYSKSTCTWSIEGL